jgi:PAS domain S-box-containing protein
MDKNGKKDKSKDTNQNTNRDIHHELYKDNTSNLDIPELFRLIIANTRASGMIMMDSEGTILATNMGMLNSYGYNSEEIVGKKFNILYTENDRAKKIPEMELATVLQKGSSKDENYCVHKNGTYLWTLGESIFTKNDKGEIFILKIIFDINRQKLLEQHLIQSNNELNSTLHKLTQLNNDLETFVYTASHDLKAPIGNIEALIMTLQEELTEDSRQKTEVKEIISMIEFSITKFRTSISELAVVGKLKSEENEKEEVSEISFSEILNDVKALLQLQINESKTIFEEDFSKAKSMRFSKKNLNSILHNLISNAIKYRHPDKQPRIRISTENIDDFILLKVSDNGLGIKDEDKGKIFSIYERAHDHVEGTGVGMAIISRIVNNNGGKIELESKVGEGSSFKVFLKK